MKKVLLFLMISLFGLTLSSCKPVNSSSEVIEESYKITYVENDNCTIELSKNEAKANEKIEVAVIDINKDYQLNKITVNDMVIDNNSFIMPKEDVVVKVYLVNMITGPYALDIVKSEYAIISTTNDEYQEGENVSIDYTCKGNYILDKFLVNGSEIDGTSFVMPKDNVVLEGKFKKAIEYTDWQIAVESATNVARAHWYFEYGEKTLNIKVKVEDRIICGYQYAESSGYQDNVEIILTPKTDTVGWSEGKSYKFLVSCEGDSIVNIATSSTLWGDFWDYSKQDYGYSVTLKNMDDNDGYNGYEIDMYVSYSLLGLTKEQAIGNISACLAMRNVNAYGATAWGYYAGKGSWENCYSHPLISSDGKLQERG